VTTTRKLPEPALLLVSVLGRDDRRLLAAVAELEKNFGVLDCLTTRLPFDFSDYYAAEMGRPLGRYLAVFGFPFHRQRLPVIKNFTGELESRFAGPDGRRTVNLDPGYLAIEHLVLASTKPSYHRPYLGDGIYADLTLIYQHGAYRPLPWTYPDYASREYLDFFAALRRKLLWLRKQPAWSRSSASGK
jgi:hypothetical protein